MKSIKSWLQLQPHPFQLMFRSSTRCPGWTVGDAIARSVCCRIGIIGRGVLPQLQDLHEPSLVTSA